MHVNIERAAVNVTTTVPPLPGHKAQHQLAKAKSLHNLMIRLLENGQSAEAADLPRQILAAYQQAAASAGSRSPSSKRTSQTWSVS